MSKINDYSMQAELAQAAYGTFSNGVILNTDLTNISVGMSPTQATFFASKWQVADQYNDPVTGLSATVFEAIGGGTKHLAIRGTEITGKDLLADGLLTTSLPPTLNPQFTALQLQLNDVWLNDPAIFQGQSFTVSGHSLGGYLAAAVKQNFTQATDAYIYNAPGVSGLLGNLAGAISSALGLGSILPDKIWNIRGSEGFPVIAGLGYQLGTPVNIQIEASLNNHSISVLADALAIYSLYSQLAPSLNVEKLTQIIDAFGSTKDAGISNSNTLEFALDALRTIVLNPANGQIVLGDSDKTAGDDREAFYTNLKNLQGSQEFSGLASTIQLTPLSDLSTSDIIAKIENNDPQGLAARFAFVTLNPFILETVGIDYSAFNIDGALDLYDPLTDTGTLTSKYMVDRISFLERKLWFNIEDKRPLDSNVVSSLSNHPFQNINDFYEDVASGYNVSQGELTANTPHYFFGGDGVDQPFASAVEDHFYGGGGDDILKGGEGNDYLEGGMGLDTYIINPGDGTDTILDTDGVGVIKFGTVVAKGKDGVTDDSGWIKVGNSWTDLQNDIRYILSSQANGANDLLVNLVKDGDSARAEIKAWNDGELGITLGAGTQPEAPIFDRTIVGDLQPEDPVEVDDLGNVVVGTEEALDREDTLYGSANNDLIQSLGGDDDVDAKAGEDRIEGGSGEDNLEGGSDNDIVLGGADSDILSGGEGNDWLFAETEFTIDDAYSLGRTQAASGERGDLLDGGAGDDTLIGEAGEDILMGGMGKDIIMGLGGDDTIEGDNVTGLVVGNWDVTRDAIPDADSTNYNRNYNFSATFTDAGDNDVIYSGAGNDWIFAQGGNDFIDAGTGNDVVFGDAGNDTILGQSGNDILVGDAKSLDASLHGDDYLSGGEGNDTLDGGGGSDYLDGGVGDDKLLGDEGNDTLIGGSGADILGGRAGDDVLEGGDDNDALFGNDGNDTLIGGAGSDQLDGGAGDDTYVDVSVDDTVIDLEGRSTIMYADAGGVSTNTSSSKTTWSKDMIPVLRIPLDNDTTLDLPGALYGMDANIQFSGGNAIDLESWVSDNLLDSVRLDMGSLATSSGQAITQAYGGGAADLIQGSSNNDVIRGHGGNDQLSSKAGDDLLVGGSGNDTLFGGDGADTLQGGLGADQYTGGGGADIYVFDMGDGTDIITSASVDDAAGDEVHLGFGIAANDLQFFQLADGNLLMRIVGGQDSILFEGWFTEGPNVTALRLDDNSVISASEMSALVSDVYGGTPGDDMLVGTTADDRIEGYAGNDSLDGGAGSDILVGGDGNDTYLFGLGSIGNDVAVEISVGESIIALTNGTTLADLRYTWMENDLILALRGDNATLMLQDYYVSPQNWTISDETNATIAVADWLALPPPVIDIAQLQTDFLDTVRAQWASDLLRNINDMHHGQYERVDEVTFHARSVTAFETDISTRHFIEVDNISDAANILRQSDSHDVSFGTVNIYSDAQVIDGIEGDYFYSLDLLFLIPPGPSQDIENWEAVLDSNGELIGFMVHVSTPPMTETQDHLQTTKISNTQVENIEGGNSDNIIKGYKNGNFGGDFATSNLSDDEISIIDGGGGNDIVHASGKIGLNNEEFYFTDTAPRIGGFIYGNTGDDTLYGNNYRDTLIGGDGNDLLDGGFSQDTYVMLSGELGVDTIWDTGTQLFQIGSFRGDEVESFVRLQGIPEPTPVAQDILNLAGINQGDIVLTWGERAVKGVRDNSQEGEIEFIETLYSQTMHTTLILTWTGGGVEIVLPNSTDLPGMGLELIQFGDGAVLTMAELITLAGPAPTFDPQELDNIIAGQNTNDVIYGEGGNDTLDGGSGDDFLNGGTGNDILTGGSGNDTYHFGIGSGQDIINSHDTTIGKIDTVEIHYSIDPDGIHVGRSGNDLVLSIIGTTDTLTIQNYLENDGITPFSVEQIEFDNETWDLATIQVILGSNRAPELSVALLDQEATEGSAFSYTVDVNAFTDPDVGDMLSHSATLADGSRLPSWLSFDAETLIISGIPEISGVLNIRVTAKDSGDLTVSDVFDIDVSNQGLVLNGTSGTDLLDGGVGNDTLKGFAGNDILNGNLGNDLLNGGAGIDTMSGGTGDDIYVVNSVQDIVIENLDEGIDSIRSSISYVIGTNVENLKLIGTEVIDGTGNALDNKLIGNDANNLLTGKAGNDWLVGKEGADTMIGGSGDDIYIVDNVGDNVIELGDEGVDKVRSSVSYTLSENVEDLVLTDIATINGTGNALDNSLIGNSAANTLTGESGNDRLNGREGADMMIGGVGDDIYVVDNVGDIVNELADEGVDRVRSSISYTLSENVDDLVLIDSMAINGTGNALNNKLIGNDANNILMGEAGNDRLNGKEGADTLVGGSGNDVYILGRDYGVDTLIEDDSTIGNVDTVRFLSDISADQIWFQHIGNNLKVSIIGTADKLVLNDWYLGSANHVERFKTSDGLTLLDSQVDDLVVAMAGFAPPPDAGQISLPADYAVVLDPLIASLWVNN